MARCAASRALASACSALRRSITPAPHQLPDAACWKPYMLKAGCGQIPCALNATSDVHTAMPSAHAARMTASSALSNVCSLLHYHHSCKMRVTSGHDKR